MSCVRRIRTVTPVLPARTGRHDGLAYTLWLPDRDRPPVSGGEPLGGVVILHGADSVKESHHDFARALMAAGFAAVCFDQRGHGESDGPMDGRAAQDVGRIADLLRDALGRPDAPIALRGSSLGGYLAIVSADAARAAAIVAICPAPAELLRAGLRHHAFGFAADEPSLVAFLDANDLHDAVATLTVPLLILHAEGDERVPVEHSRELAAAMTVTGSRLIAVPGGHHRSIQHDEELQAVSLGFLRRTLAPA
jgi:alpha-beta hydrolase superfamily lysophospholipase